MRIVNIDNIFKIIGIIMLGLLLTFNAQAVPLEQWSKTFGGSDDDNGHSVQRTSDGGYIIVGTTGSYDTVSSNVYLIKTDSSGNKLWEKIFGGSRSDDGNSVQQTSDGGYIIVGSTSSYGDYTDNVYLIKTDSSGNKLWEKIFGGSSSDDGNSVQQTPDGGYIIVGTTFYGIQNSKVYLIKIDSSGNKLWEKSFGEYCECSGSSIQQTSDGGYIILGNVYFFGGMYSTYLIKTDSSGNKLWEKFVGNDGISYGTSVQKTSDGGYIVVGSRVATDIGGVFLIRTDSSGNQLWEKTYIKSGNDDGNSVQQTSDGGYIVVGSTDLFGDYTSDVFLIKTDSSGNKLWEKTFGGSDSDYGKSVQKTSDGGYIIIGGTRSYGAGKFDVYMIKVSDNNPQSSITVTSPNGGENWYRGTVKDITWTYTGNPGVYVKIELLKAGVVVNTISSSSQNDGLHQWYIPSTLTLGTDYKIKVTSTSNSAYTDMSNNNFIISSGTSITVTSPNGGESWIRGITKTITWSNTGSPGSYVKIDLYKAGVFKQTIVSSTSNDGSHPWYIPTAQMLGTDYKIKVTSTSNSAYTDMSNNNFAITSGTSAITVVSPNGGENWIRGTNKEIKWSSTGTPGANVKIELYKAGVLNKVITSNTPNDGSFIWYVPTTQTIAGDYKIKVTSTSNSAYTDMSNNNFMISSGSIIVASPNGGESWQKGTTKTITWSRTGSTGSYVRIELLKGGVLNRVISSSTPNDGSQSWTILSTQTYGTDYKVRITSTSNSIYKDISNNNFKIY